MPVVPSGSLSLAMQLLRATLADSTTFRNLVTPTMDQAAALGRIYYERLPPPAGDTYTLDELATYRPYALIYVNPNHGFRREVEGVDADGYTWSDRGKLVVSLEVTASETDGYGPTPDAELTFTNQAGGILDEISDLAGNAGYINAIAIETLLGPYSVGEDDAPHEGIWQAVHLSIEYRGIR